MAPNSVLYTEMEGVMPITAISPTPVPVGTEQIFTAAVVPWDVNIPTYTPIFEYQDGAAAPGKITDFIGKSVEEDQEQLNIIHIDAGTIPPNAAPGKWKATLQFKDKNGKYNMEVDSVVYIQFY